MKIIFCQFLVVVFLLISIVITPSLVEAPYPKFSASALGLSLTKDWNKLRELLRDRNLYPEKSNEIDTKINQLFAQTHAVMVLDLSGFSQTTAQEGIISTLAIIQKIDDIVLNIINHKQGKVIKFQADDVYAIFPTVEQGVAASIEIIEELANQHIYVSIGMGYGKLLMLDGIELFGSELNLAAKLGEDIGKAKEILLTESAFYQIKSPSKQWKKLEKFISGLELTFYKFIPNF